MKNTITVDVEVSLDEFDEDEIIAYLEGEGYTVLNEEDMVDYGIAEHDLNHPKRVINHLKHLFDLRPTHGKAEIIEKINALFDSI